jgi:hypothetical protein
MPLWEEIKWFEIMSALQHNGNGFNVTFFPAINNAQTRNFGYGFTEQGINSLFGSAEISYDGWLYITATGRNDWFSVLNPEFNSIFYPSIGASWVVSDTFKSMPSAPLVLVSCAHPGLRLVL